MISLVPRPLPPRRGLVHTVLRGEGPGDEERPGTHCPQGGGPWDEERPGTHCLWGGGTLGRGESWYIRGGGLGTRLGNDVLVKNFLGNMFFLSRSQVRRVKRTKKTLQQR